MRSVGERKTVVAAYRTGHAFSCVLALACACLLAVVVALSAPAPAQAASPNISGISNGQVDVATEGVSVSVFFGHNVAAGAIFDANATKFSLRDASGAEVGVSVYRKYNGYGAPDADNPDPEGLRRYIYVSFPLVGFWRYLYVQRASGRCVRGRACVRWVKRYVHHERG